MFEVEDDLWDAYLKEGISYLQRYIKIDTSKPQNVMGEGIEFWKEIYEKENVPFQIYTSEGNKKSIVGKFEVSNRKDAKNIVLLNHIDVVPANKTEWDFDPYGGEVKDGKILGRGTMDMKGLAIIQLMTAIFIKKQNKKLKYNICILSVPDEESGGFEGAQFVTEHYLAELNPIYVLDEGTYGISHKNKNTFFVSYSQKKSLWLKLKVDGEEGHGACPKENNPNVMLIDILRKIQKNCRDSSNASKVVYFDDWKTHHRLLFQILCKAHVTDLLFLFQKKKLINRVLYFNTISNTSIKSESLPNVIPHSSEIVLDCRLLPEENVDGFIDKIYKWVGNQNVSISVIKRTDFVQSSNTENELMSMIKKVVRDEVQNSRMKKIVSPVGTDSKYFRNYNIDAYGFYPILLEIEDLKRMHGKNECITVYQFNMAMKIYVKILLGFHM